MGYKDDNLQDRGFDGWQDLSLGQLLYEN